MYEINRPEIAAEVKAAFDRYEAALAENDVVTLNALFWQAPQTVRFGTAENLYGYDAIAAFRGARIPPGARMLRQIIITTYGSDFATADTEFPRLANPDLAALSRGLADRRRACELYGLAQAHYGCFPGSGSFVCKIAYKMGRHSII
jgi:hypothetical protein